jgi:glyoxylase-like metal-dependent hydrolase (beta-lactamase superfamily II)
MHQIENGILYEDIYLGVTLGALVCSHGVIIIDAPIRAEDARSWRSTLINQRGGPNRLLVNLDSHPDRTLGARSLECTIVAHQNAAQVFRNRPTIFKGQSVETGEVWETYGEAIGMRWAPPDIMFTQSMSLHWGGPEVVLEYHPGPTLGSIWVIVPEARVVFVGDAVLTNQPPFMAQADLDAWIESLDVLAERYRDYVIIGGREGPVVLKDIRKQQRILRKIINRMDKLATGNSPPDATEKIIPEILSHYTYPLELQDLYTNRLRYGLYQNFARRYRRAGALGQLEEDVDG